MKVFALEQHRKDFSVVRELRDDELNTVAGGIKANTVTSTWDRSDQKQDGGDDGDDEI